MRPVAIGETLPFKPTNKKAGARQCAPTQSCLLNQCLGIRQAQLAGDQAGEQGVAEGGEGLGLLLHFYQAANYWSSNNVTL
jgi:hypothetical protein